MTIIHQQQPNNSTCGQTCVAMVANLPVREIISDVFGHKRGTTTDEVVRALRECGFTTSKQRVQISKHKPLPELAIMHMSRKGIRHWCVLHQGAVYCPSLGVFSLKDYLETTSSRFHSGILIEDTAYTC